ncbi:MAG: hypothetical protein RSD23_08455 [Ruthenibacterium sp.]
MKFVKRTDTDIRLVLTVNAFYSLGISMVLDAAVGGQAIAEYRFDGISYKFAVADLAELLTFVLGILGFPEPLKQIILYFDDAHLYNGHYEFPAKFVVPPQGDYIKNKDERG